TVHGVAHGQLVTKELPTNYERYLLEAIMTDEKWCGDPFAPLPTTSVAETTKEVVAASVEFHTLSFAIGHAKSDAVIERLLEGKLTLPDSMKDHGWGDIRVDYARLEPCVELEWVCIPRRPDHNDNNNTAVYPTPFGAAGGWGVDPETKLRERFYLFGSGQ